MEETSQLISSMAMVQWSWGSKKGYWRTRGRGEGGGTGLKILTPKQMLQRLPIAVAQVKEGNNSESLLSEIRQIGYSLYQSKQIIRKVNNHIIESIQ